MGGVSPLAAAYAARAVSLLTHIYMYIYIYIYLYIHLYSYALAYKLYIAAAARCRQVRASGLRYDPELLETPSPVPAAFNIGYAYTHAQPNTPNP